MKPIKHYLGLFTLAGALAHGQYLFVDLTPNATGVSSANGTTTGFEVGSTSNHATIWGGSGSGVDVHPSGWYRSVAQAMSGLGQSVGFGTQSASADASVGYHALLWPNLSAQFIDLHPQSGYASSLAFCAAGLQQGGYGVIKASGKGGATPPTHALVWAGSPSSVVDLNPAGKVQSRAFGCSGTQQVGGSSVTATSYEHATLWWGSASSAIDLNPPGWDSSVALATTGAQQVGTGVIGGARHAILWNGNAASAVDLHPAGYTISVAYATTGHNRPGPERTLPFHPATTPSSGQGHQHLHWT